MDNDNNSLRFIGNEVASALGEFSPMNLLQARDRKEQYDREQALKTPFERVIDEVMSLHNKKQEDYGRSDIGDPFSNVRASEDFNIPGWVGAVVRANDKVRRIQKFVRSGNLVNESVEDSLMDAAIYFLIALCLYREANE